MKWRVGKPGAKRRLKKQWHRWYAWYPVRVPTYGRMSGQHRVCLVQIWRRGTPYRTGQYGEHECWSWEYHEGI